MNRERDRGKIKKGKITWDITENLQNFEDLELTKLPILDEKMGYSKHLFWPTKKLRGLT